MRFGMEITHEVKLILRIIIQKFLFGIKPIATKCVQPSNLITKIYNYGKDNIFNDDRYSTYFAK